MVGKVDVCAASLVLALPHECRLVGELIGIGAGLAGEDLVQALGGNAQDAGLEDVGPVVLGEVAERWSVDQGGGHFGRGSSQEEGGVVVAHGNGGNLGIHIEQDVAVEVSNVVAIAALVVGHHVQAPRVEHLVQPLNGLDALWTRNGCLHNWA